MPSPRPIILTPSSPLLSSLLCFLELFAPAKVSVKGDGNDLLFTCSHKTEFATTVVQGAESLLGAAVPLVFSNTMTLRFASVYERTVVFEENEDHEAVHTKISEPRLRQGAKE